MVRKNIKGEIVEVVEVEHVINDRSEIEVQVTALQAQIAELQATLQVISNDLAEYDNIKATS